AFLGDSPPNKTHVLHKDDIKTNNHVSNLYWGDDADNMRDMIKNGRLLRGSDKTDAKLSEEDIENIRAKYAEGNVTQHQLAEEYDVHQVHISRIISGKEWTHVGGVISSTNRGNLSEETVLEIRNSYNIGVFSQREIADAYGLDQSHISRIVNHKIWTHI